MANNKAFSAAWQQFLLAKQAMLGEYDRAVGHSKTQAVQSHHGVVAEAAVRDWLGTFLPKRYGVTSGYIRSQGLSTLHQSSHFDVIIYDQVEAPTLWIEENPDKSEAGRARIIPAENVGAVFEVKAAFNRRSVSESIDKLGQLAPLTNGVDAANERYPRHLPRQAILVMLFFELRRVDQADLVCLENLRTAEFGRPLYGPVILRGEGLSQGDTGLATQTVSHEPMERLFVHNGLLHNISMTDTIDVAGQHRGAMLHWSDINFSKFAFDLLALLKGTYEHGRASSFHGIDFGQTGKS